MKNGKKTLLAQWIYQIGKFRHITYLFSNALFELCKCVMFVIVFPVCYFLQLNVVLYPGPNGLQLIVVILIGIEADF